MTTTRDGRPVTDTRIYRVTQRGLAQIVEWMLKHYTEVDDGAAAAGEWTLPYTEYPVVREWVHEAEQSPNGKIKMPGHKTHSGRPVYLTPKRVAVMRAYAYRTDSEAGTIYAFDFKDARDQLDAMVPAMRILDGGWGWVDDCDRKRPRYEIGQR